MSGCYLILACGFYTASCLFSLLGNGHISTKYLDIRTDVYLADLDISSEKNEGFGAKKIRVFVIICEMNRDIRNDLYLQISRYFLFFYCFQDVVCVVNYRVDSYCGYLA